MIQKNALAKVLRTLATTIEGMAEEHVELLLTGKGKLTFTPSEKPKNVQVEPSADHAALMSRLNECKDRDQARRDEAGHGVRLSRVERGSPSYRGVFP